MPVFDRIGVGSGSQVALALLLTVVVAAPAQASSASKSGASIAQARVDGPSGAVASFGGKGTRAATSSGTTGVYLVTFTGRYPADISANNLIVQSTCNSGGYGVSNSYVSSATPTQISIGVYCWASDTRTYLSNDLFVNVYAGAAP